MNLRTPLVLFGIFLALVAIFFALQFFGVQTPKERRETEKYLLASLHKGKDRFAIIPAADFTQVLIERVADGKQEKIEFHRKTSGDGKSAGPWEMVSPRKLRVSTRAVDMLIEQLVEAQKDVKAELEKDLSLYGLDKPAVTITLTREVKDKEGNKTGTQTIRVSFGKTSPHKDDPLIYAVTSEDPGRPAAVPKSRVERALGTVHDFRDKDLLGSTLNVTGVRLAGQGRKPLELVKDKDRDWLFLEPKLGEADSRATDDLLFALSDIRVARNEDFVDDGPLDDARLAGYGLTADKATAVATFRTKGSSDKETKETTLLIGARDASQDNQASAIRAGLLVAEHAWLAAGPWSGLAAVAVHRAREADDAQKGSYFARLAEDDFVVRVEAKHLKAFEKHPDELRSRRLARLDASKVDAIDLKSGSEYLRFRRPKLASASDAKAPASGSPPSEWDLHTEERAAVKTHLDTVTRLIDAVNKIELASAKSFLDDDAKQRAWFGTDPVDLGLDQPRAVLSLWEEGILRDKEGKPEGTKEPKLKDEVRDKPTVRLAIGRKDDKRGVVYVRRERPDLPPTILAVPDPWYSSPPSATDLGTGSASASVRESIALSELVTAGYYHYRDRVLPSFKAEEAIKVVYVRGETEYVLERPPPAEGESPQPRPWKLKQPVEGDGATATDMLLFSLSRIGADKLVTDRATDRDRKEKFGLADAPLIDCTVTVKEKEKKDPASFRYVIGAPVSKEGNKSKEFYARVEIKKPDSPAPDANDFVFLLSEDVVRMLDVELRANTVFQSEKSAKPAAVKLTWHDKAKNFERTVLEVAYRKGPEGSDKGSWEVASYQIAGQEAKEQAPKLDFSKFDRLVGISTGVPQVDLLVTDRFVLHKGEAKPEWRLNPDNPQNPPSLVLEVKYDNGTSRTLIVGETWTPDPEKTPGLRLSSYFLARASSLPEAVFLLNGVDFRELVAGVSYFRATEPMAGRLHRRLAALLP